MASLFAPSPLHASSRVRSLLRTQSLARAQLLRVRRRQCVAQLIAYLTQHRRCCRHLRRPTGLRFWWPPALEQTGKRDCRCALLTCACRDDCACSGERVCLCMLHAILHLIPVPLGGRSHATIAPVALPGVGSDLAVDADATASASNAAPQVRPSFLLSPPAFVLNPAACDTFNRPSCCSQAPRPASNSAPAQPWRSPSPSSKRSDFLPAHAMVQVSPQLPPQLSSCSMRSSRPSMQTHISSCSADFAGLAPAAYIQQVPSMLHRTQLLRCHRAASRLPQQRSRSVCMTFGRLNALLAQHSPAHMPLCRCPRSLHHAAAPLVQPSAKPTSIATRLAFLAGGCSHAAAARPRQPRPHAICTLAQGSCTRLAAFALRASVHFTQPALLASRRLQPAATRRGSPTQSEPRNCVARAPHKRGPSATHAQHSRSK